jgi:uncharacterized protein (TIGR03792 family)
MIVEFLQFRIQPGHRSHFLERNERLWTPALRTQPGFVRREILASADEPDAVIILVYWDSHAEMQAFPVQLQASLDAQMADLVLDQTCSVFERIIPAE